MDNWNKPLAVIGAIAAVAVAALVIMKTTAPADTNAGAQESAQALVKSRNATDVVAQDKYEKLMANAKGPGSIKKGSH
jgi:hypothetical protein